MVNEFIAVSFKSASSELLSMWLEPLGVLSIEERGEVLIGYWTEEDWNQIKKNLSSEIESNDLFSILEVHRIEQQNWNKQWEESFHPIEVNKFCRIRASFHESLPGYQYEILIEPKMSFGTGHHATTWQMIQMMSKMDITGLSVLDYGCGTGILAILAHKMGASSIDGFDYDKWCYENARDNAELNGIDSINWSVNTLESFNATNRYDLILANINRNVLIESVKGLSDLSKSSTTLLISGFYESDLPLLQDAYKSDFDLVEHTKKDKWCCAVFKKLQ